MATIIASPTSKGGGAPATLDELRVRIESRVIRMRFNLTVLPMVAMPTVILYLFNAVKMQ